MFSERNLPIILFRIKCQLQVRGWNLGCCNFRDFFTITSFDLSYAMLGTLMCESFLVQLIIREHLQASDRRERCSPCLQKRGRDLRDIVIQTSFHPVLLCSSLHLIFTFRGSLWYQFPNFFASNYPETWVSFLSDLLPLCICLYALHFHFQLLLSLSSSFHTCVFVFFLILLLSFI